MDNIHLYTIETLTGKILVILLNIYHYNPVSGKINVGGDEYMNKPWTPEENEFLRQNYGKMLTAEIAKYLNKSTRAVSQHAYNLHHSKHIRPSVFYKEALPQERQIKAQVFMAVIHMQRKKCIKLNLSPNIDLKAIAEAIKNVERLVLI